jgi:hypothetical protein
VGVTYYDFTSDTPASATLDTDTWFTAARRGDARFSPRQRLAQPFDMRTAPDANGFFVGDYEGLATSGRRFASVFVTANSGNLANRTDVFSTLVQPSFAPAQASARTARASARGRLARLVKQGGGISGPVRIR